MADHDSRGRYLALVEAVIGLYAYVSALLEELPLPIVVPDIVQSIDEDQDPADCLMALNRARALVEDEPISDTAKRAYEHMLLDWFAAYEIIVLVKMAGPAPWRLDAVEFALNRIVTWFEVIEEEQMNDGQS
ncbi:hypothetical protein ACWC9Q_29720 [Streptomyces sp. NPDC001142]